MNQPGTVAAVMNAERIKLTTVRSTLWSAVAVAVLSLGTAALQGATAYDYVRLTPPAAALGVVVFGVPVLMVVAAITVTGEYAPRWCARRSWRVRTGPWCLSPEL